MRYPRETFRIPLLSACACPLLRAIDLKMYQRALQPFAQSLCILPRPSNNRSNIPLRSSLSTCHTTVLDLHARIFSEYIRLLKTNQKMMLDIRNGMGLSSLANIITEADVVLVISSSNSQVRQP